MMDKLLSARGRRWLYSVAIAFVPLAALWGWITPDAMPLVLPLVMAVLNVQDDNDDE